MKSIIKSIQIGAILLSGLSLSTSAATNNAQQFDLTKLRYTIDTPSVFHNKDSKEIERINSFIDPAARIRKAAEVDNPSPAITLPGANIMGSIDAPNGELWYYTGEFDYLEIPPHDDVWFTDRILQEYSFTIYDSQMKVIGTIKDKMDYADDEVRVVMCEITPVATRNFFNTDDNIELMVALAVNIEGGGNHYRSLVYVLGGEKDADGFDKVVDVMDDLVGDVIEGPAVDGKDNFYITFMTDVFEFPEDGKEDSFWDYLLAQKAAIIIYGRALDDKGPRVIYEQVIPLIQLPGDQQDVSPLMSVRRGDDVIFSISSYKLPFYDEYNDPFSEDMTQREGNTLLINLYKASETGLTPFSQTEIPVVLDPMLNDEDDPTCLFSYFSVGSLNYSSDILFDAPGVVDGKPDFIITRGNYQVSTDGIINSYFTYKNDGTLKNTLFVYADGTRTMGNLPGFEPQQLFVSKDYYGYVYNFVDLYSATLAAEIPADYSYDEDSDTELLSSNVARTPVGDSYQYVYELRYPLVDEDENDILRFMYINADGTYNHTELINMGHGVAYAQSYLSTESVAPHAYSSSDTPTFMMLIKRGVDGSDEKIEELMVAEAITDQDPQGKILLQVGPNNRGGLASIVPEFAQAEQPGRLLVYYYDTETSLYSLDIYALPLGDTSGIENIKDETPTFSIQGTLLVADGEIKVYSIDGKLVASGINSVEFASLNSGVYIVSAGGKSYKIIK